MTRMWRTGAALFILVLGVMLAGAPAHAECTNPTDPDFGQCTGLPTAAPTPKATPKPSTTPTGAPTTTAPTRAPVRPVTPVRTSTPSTPFSDGVEVPTETAPLSSIDVFVEPQPESGQLNDDIDNAGSVTNWIFGFIVGLIVGLFIGRASWGIRRKRRQQIFG